MAQITFDIFNKEEVDKVSKLVQAIWGANAQPQPTPTPAMPQPAPAMPQPAPAMPPPAPAMQQPAPAPQQQVGADVSDAALQGLVQRLIQAQLPGVDVPRILGILTSMGVATIGQLPPEKRQDFKTQVVALSGGMIQ